MLRLCTVFAFIPVVLTLFACGGGDPQYDLAQITSVEKGYVGSEQCKMCHLEHYDSWKMTLHSRMLQDAKANKDVFVVDLDHEVIKADFQKLDVQC